ncbi:uncharacterized protein [Dermacentor andersoni]|uniref:uncharacterized protein n=1 Tax=Dermacentor andersoni TaxID=34620 RepID=UPI002415E748|nr:uncharacterized protein LOC126540067 [Dermacentor andersoni]
MKGKAAVPTPTSLACAAGTAGYPQGNARKTESKASAATTKSLATAGQAAASRISIPKDPVGAVKPAVVATDAALPGPSNSKASRTLRGDVGMVSLAAYGPGPSGAPASEPTPKDPVRALGIPAGFNGPAGEVRGAGPPPQPSRENLGSGRMPSVRFDTVTAMYEGADIAQISTGGASFAGFQQPPKKRSRIKRPPELPYLRLPKFSLAPLRIIGLLRPRASHPRKQPTLRELLQEAQVKEQDRLNLDTKERERQLTLVVVVLVLFLYYLGMTASAYYFELTDITPATPGGRRPPIDLLRSTVNGSID